MTVKEIEERVAMLKSLARDQEAFDATVRRIHEDVLEYIATGPGVPQPKSLAKAALGK
jgi:hypothetical protein